MLIGREEQKSKLNLCLADKKSHFVVIYGRRRVGKTFLIKEHFNNNFTFYCTGLLRGKKQQQLNNFVVAMSNQLKHFDSNVEINTWYEAFTELIKALSKIKDKTKKVIFLDELPWMDNQGSDFVLGLEYFWNSWASARKDLLFIACGSATTWIVSNLLTDTGGLYNRVTMKIKVDPFDLNEVYAFFKSKGFLYNQEQCVQSYMTLGGIPYYLEQFVKEKSPVQNIDELFFGENAILNNEYQALFKSLFKKYQTYITIIETIAIKNKGLSRDEIVRETGFSDGGNLTKMLVDLENCNFIRKYRSYGNKSKQTLYQLIDPYCLFYKNFQQKFSQNNFWVNNFASPKYNNWAGYAFEILCLNHLKQIKHTLGISGIEANAFNWSNEYAQVDLVIERGDNVINFVEMKYAKGPYLITKKYDGELRNKVQQFEQRKSKGNSIWPVIIAPYGLGRSMYNHFFIKEIILEDLFRAL